MDVLLDCDAVTAQVIIIRSFVEGSSTEERMCIAHQTHSHRRLSVATQAQDRDGLLYSKLAAGAWRSFGATLANREVYRRRAHIGNNDLFP